MDDSVWVAGCTGPVKAPSAVLHAVVPGRRLRGSRPEGASAKTRRFGRRLVPRPGCGRFGAQGMPGRSGRAGAQDVGSSGRRAVLAPVSPIRPSRSDDHRGAEKYSGDGPNEPRDVPGAPDKAPQKVDGGDDRPEDGREDVDSGARLVVPICPLPPAVPPLVPVIGRPVRLARLCVGGGGAGCRETGGCGSGRRRVGRE